MLHHLRASTAMRAERGRAMMSLRAATAAAAFEERTLHDVASQRVAPMRAG
jgi:hypothetical protein